jgi:hypothetical protein
VGDTVQVFKRARAGGVTVCAEVATGMHENTDFGKVRRRSELMLPCERERERERERRRTREKRVGPKHTNIDFGKVRRSEPMLP